jgi:hypothetical protein
MWQKALNGMIHTLHIINIESNTVDIEALIQNKQASSFHLIDKNHQVIFSSDQQHNNHQFDISSISDKLFNLFNSNIENEITSLKIQDKNFVIMNRPLLNAVIACTKCKYYSLLVYRLHSDLCLCVFIERPLQIKNTLKIVETFCKQI